MAKRVRAILDDGGLKDTTIFVSGGVDEDALLRFRAGGAPIDGFGIGTSLTVSPDAPTIDCAYKLQEYRGIAKRKRSVGKETWPGRKQVWRTMEQGRMTGDVLSVDGDSHPGDQLIVPVMKAGKRLAPAPTLAAIRERAAASLAALPEPLRQLTSFDYSVTPAEKLRALAAAADGQK
jgi:nicotinate phosphoribosyltransferase